VALSVVLNVVLVPKFGVVGSAIADTASLLAWNIWMTYAAERELGIAVTVLGRRLPSWRSRKSIGD
jgi:O-antigen/teichoic acid export membrane protein